MLQWAGCVERASSKPVQSEMTESCHDDHPEPQSCRTPHPSPSPPGWFPRPTKGPLIGFPECQQKNERTKQMLSAILYVPSIAVVAIVAHRLDRFVDLGCMETIGLAGSFRAWDGDGCWVSRVGHPDGGHAGGATLWLTCWNHRHWCRGVGRFHRTPGDLVLRKLQGPSRVAAGFHSCTLASNRKRPFCTFPLISSPRPCIGMNHDRRQCRE